MIYFVCFYSNFRRRFASILSAIPQDMLKTADIIDISSKIRYQHAGLPEEFIKHIRRSSEDERQ